jgi:hypothetical protein
MEMFINTDLTIPIEQIIFLLLLSTLALLYWGYVFNRDKLLVSGFELPEFFTILYFLFGIGVIVMACFAFIFHRDQA